MCLKSWVPLCVSYSSTMRKRWTESPEKRKAPLWLIVSELPFLFQGEWLGTGSRSVAMDQEAERTPESGAGITFKDLPLVTLFCQQGPTFSRCHHLQINTSRWGTDIQNVSFAGNIGDLNLNTELQRREAQPW